MMEKYNTSNTPVGEVLRVLSEFCEAENFRGWDPYDGLNSKVFKFLGLGHFAFSRLAWIQLFKRSPVNFRPLLLVPVGHNAKGLGLFLSGYSKMLLRENQNGRKNADLENIVRRLGNLLIDMRSEGYSGSCWGYNFDWQARGGLYFPSGTPTVVATTYASYGLFDAYEATGEQKFLDVALDSTKFVLHDLSRDFREDGSFIFSYSVKQGNNTVYNASLLGSKLLSRAYHYTCEEDLIHTAKLSVQAVLNAQEEDGSWIYGEGPTQTWKDSFHTGFNLESLQEYMKYSGDTSVETGIRKGFDFYISNFFTANGAPKYYHDRLYPIDIHCPAQLIVTLDSLGKLDEYSTLANTVLGWTFKHMKDRAGFFYYQKKALFTSRVPYMRWSQAWMMHSLTVFLLAGCEK